jgi:hypothetical protein
MIASGAAQPQPATGAGMPQVGQTLSVNGAPGWARVDFLYDAPSPNDSAGKVVIFWFCAPRIAACQDDLARLVTLKENGHVYIVAYINGSKADAKRLDPIRESEGVGSGTTAFGPGVTADLKKLGVAGPVSIVVDTDEKIQFVTTGSSPSELDARDAKVDALIVGTHEIRKTSEGPKATLKPGEKFTLSLTVTLARWLKFSSKNQAPSFKAMLPPDIKCDAKTLDEAHLKIADNSMTAIIQCSGPKGVYEATGDLKFGYESQAGGLGLGEESQKWKFEIKP